IALGNRVENCRQGTAHATLRQHKPTQPEARVPVHVRAKLPPSLFADTARPPPDTPPLPGDRKTSVCVIGAGFTGLSAALHLAEQGTEVVVLEQNEPGWGASGRNGGQVN